MTCGLLDNPSLSLRPLLKGGALLAGLSWGQMRRLGGSGSARKVEKSFLHRVWPQQPANCDPDHLAIHLSLGSRLLRCLSPTFAGGKIEGVPRGGLKGVNKESVGLLTPCSVGARVKFRQRMKHEKEGGSKAFL